MSKEGAAPKAKDPKDQKAPKAEKAPKADKPAKGDKAEAAAAKPEKPAAPPRPPADPRLKVLKKFHGKFLPRGPLRDRHKALMTRWDSGEDHGGVTVDELKSLLNDWRATKEKPARAAKS